MKRNVTQVEIRRQFYGGGSLSIDYVGVKTDLGYIELFDAIGKVSEKIFNRTIEGDTIFYLTDKQLNKFKELIKHKD